MTDETMVVLEHIVRLQGPLLQAPPVEVGRIGPGPALKPGSTGKRVLQLNTRLAELKLLTEPFADQFSASTEMAVRQFQLQSGLVVDGIVDHQTRFNLNLSDEEKLRVLRHQLADMERFIKENQDARFILVNIPAFSLHAYEGGKRVVSSRVIVGTPARQTPMMKTYLTGMVFHPTWSPPRTILNHDIFRSGEIQPKTVSRLGLTLLDTEGKPVAMDGVQLTTPDDLVSGGYRFMQPAGEKNALGLLRFDLENPFDIYLHDTNRRDLFNRQSRALSSGCIRVERFRELAAWVTGQSVEEIDLALQKRRTRRLAVEKIPVHIVYWTAEVNQESLVFNRDVYDRLRLPTKAAEVRRQKEKTGRP